jgi:UDP-N-acetylmuramate dehydrogenase
MEVKRNFDLLTFNTFGVKAKAASCTIINSVEDLNDLILENKTLKRDIFIIGGGSNILLTKDLDKWVLINKIKGINVIEDNEKDVIVEVSSGENWHDFVLFSLEKSWFGLENLSLIPGSVGASPIQNIGAYGVEVKDFIVSVKAVYLDSGEEVELMNSSMNFSYRNSIFKYKLKGKVFITSVRFKLKKEASVNVKYKALIEGLAEAGVSNATPQDVSDVVIQVRRSKLPDPDEIGNSGSFFKNPVIDKNVYLKIEQRFTKVPHYPASDGNVKLAAGWLIEKAGWKGFREGDIGVHNKQALVLVNYGNGSGEEIKKLSDRIIDDVVRKFGIVLEREVNIL